MEDIKKEDGMGKETVQETKPKGLTRREFLRRAGVAALGIAAGLVLPDALKNTKADAPVVEAPPPDAPVEPVYTNRSLAPFTPFEAERPETREPEPPLYLREFGAPERGVIMRNKIEQGGGNPAYVEMGDPELFENMMYLRETYGAKDKDGKPLKLEITFYSSLGLMRRSPEAPLYDYPNTTSLIPYDNWVRNVRVYDENGNFLYIREYPRTTYDGEKRFRRRSDGTLEFHITLPESLPGVIPEERQINWLHSMWVGFLSDSVFLAGENGRTLRPPLRRGTPEFEDFANHPVLILRNGRVITSAFWMRMETKGNTSLSEGAK